jgi:hypothetical protein
MRIWIGIPNIVCSKMKTNKSLISGFAVLEPVIRVRYIRNCPAGARIDHRTAAEIFNTRLAAGPAAEERAVAVARLAAGPLAAYLPDATREPVLRIPDPVPF